MTTLRTCRLSPASSDTDKAAREMPINNRYETRPIVATVSRPNGGYGVLDRKRA